MIRMIKGTYGRVVGGVVEAMTKHSPPFSLSASREAELVAAGVAEKVEEPAKASPRAGKKMAELRKIAAELGIDTAATRTRSEIAAMIEAHENRHSGLIDED